MRNLFNMDNPVFRALGRLADLMILNLLFIVCSLPIVTIGASLTALNYVTLKMAENEEGYIVKPFFKSFKENFRQSTCIWLILFAIGLLLGADFYIMSYASGSVANFFRIFLTATVIVYAMVLIYVFPIQARFYNKVRITMKNALIMAIADFPRTVVMIVITVGSVIITFLTSYTLVYGMLIWLLAGFAIIAYANGFFLKKVFAKYMPKYESEDEDPDHWSVEETTGEMIEENTESTENTETTENTERSESAETTENTEN